MDDNKKGFWDTIKDGFQPAGARADQRVQEMRKQSGDQYAKDRAQGAQFMKQKFVKGFKGR